MTKIIGFLVTKEKKELDIDFFKSGLSTIELFHSGYYVYLWGIGDIETYKIDDKYSLSFPLHNSLLDRNILISFDDSSITVQNDWLGSIPVFYNQKELIVSTLSNFCIKNKTVHDEGLANFCEFGYSVFGQTMLEDVKFMSYNSDLIISNNKIKIQNRNDPLMDKDLFSSETTTEDVVHLMREYIQQIEDSIEGEIVLPTSGGYDSRILNYFIKDKSRIRSFTYGTSSDQSKSTEVVHAKKISEIYNTQWEQIELRNFYEYLDQWVELYGISTHTHGMYHIEFYTKIFEKYKFKQPTFLSGIFGDIWAGSINYEDINSFQDIIKLGYTHGLNLDLQFLNYKSKNRIKEKFFLNNKDFLENDKTKAVFTIRMKLMLISYLSQIPEYFGMPVWTPYLNFKIVISTLNLPEEQRKGRVWQENFFNSVGLGLEKMGLASRQSNNLDFEVAKNMSFEPIDVEMMKRYISKDRLEKINNLIESSSFYENIKNHLLNIPKVGGILRRVGIKNNFMQALNEYYVIKAIEKGLKYEC